MSTSGVHSIIEVGETVLGWPNSFGISVSPFETAYGISLEILGLLKTDPMTSEARHRMQIGLVSLLQVLREPKLSDLDLSPSGPVAIFRDRLRMPRGLIAAFGDGRQRRDAQNWAIRVDGFCQLAEEVRQQTVATLYETYGALLHNELPTGALRSRFKVVLESCKILRDTTFEDHPQIYH